MIIQCKSCSRKFVVKEDDIPKKGREVKCGYCSVTWHQMPVAISKENIKIKKTAAKNVEDEDNKVLSIDSIKASDGKTYKFLGSQWAQVLPSGKTGIFAKKKIGKELDKLTGRKIDIANTRKNKKIKKEMNPFSESLENDKKLPDIYKPKEGLGFLGYFLLVIIVMFSIIGFIKTFEDDFQNYFPQTQYFFEFIDDQIVFVTETIKNIIVILKDLTIPY
jgi:predicted Zn finger-like uncharacterized protein